MKSSFLPLCCLVVLSPLAGCAIKDECSLNDFDILETCEDSKYTCIKSCENGFFVERLFGCKNNERFSVPKEHLNDSKYETSLEKCSNGCYNDIACNKDNNLSVPCGDEICGAEQICRDGKCYKSCGGEICSSDLVCYNNRCSKKCDDNDACESHEVCENGYCIDPCQGKICKDSHKVCVKGRCVDKCADASCLSDESCVDGKCVKNENQHSVDLCETFTCTDTNSVCRDGKCIDLCENVSCKGESEICLFGQCIDLCSGKECTNGKCLMGACVDSCFGVACNEDQKCVNGACVDRCTDVACPNNMTCVGGNCIPNSNSGDNNNNNDDNHNHMFDRYENAPKQGQSCRKYSDCDSEPGRRDGFCDSFLNYTCSTKCSSDSQCVGDTFYCRKDGRCAPKACESIWNISSPNETLMLPIHTDYAYDITVDWGDGTNLFVAKFGDGQKLSHTYSSIGLYHIKIYENDRDIGFKWSMSVKDSPEFSFIYNPADSPKLLQFVSYGPTGFAREAFQNAKNLSRLSEVDIPDATRIGDRVFCYAESFNLDVENWDVSLVSFFRGFFNGATIFNKPLNRWDVSNATNMKNMFYTARAFNQDLSSWDVSKVTDMSGMFYAANRFDQDISMWNTSSLKTINGMFQDATDFNQNINEWNVSKVTDFVKTFQGAKSFNQALPDWDIRAGKDFSEMFGKNCGIDEAHFKATINGPYADKWAQVCGSVGLAAAFCKL